MTSRRRSLLKVIILGDSRSDFGAAAIGSEVSPADAAYGEAAANVFGKPKTKTDFMAYNGDGFKVQVPAKWIRRH